MSDVPPGEVQWRGALPAAAPWLRCPGGCLTSAAAGSCCGCIGRPDGVPMRDPLLPHPPPAVRWEDVLALELRWSREMRYPDRLVVHRKGKLDQPVGGGGSDAAHARACLLPGRAGLPLCR